MHARLLCLKPNMASMWNSEYAAGNMRKKGG